MLTAPAISPSPLYYSTSVAADRAMRPAILQVSRAAVKTLREVVSLKWRNPRSMALYMWPTTSVDPSPLITNMRL